MRVQVTMTGMSHFEQQLQRLGAAAAKEARLVAVTAGARIVQADASKRAKRSAKPSAIGHMADHIIVKATTNKRYETVVAVGPDSKHFYGRFVELGTSRMTARPFLRPAFDENMDDVQSEIRERLRAEIRRLTGV